MDWQIVINIGATVVLGVFGYFFRELIADNKAVAANLVAEQKTTARELNELRVRVAQDYVTHVALGEIKQTLIRIEGKIDEKADKP